MAAEQRFWGCAVGLILCVAALAVLSAWAHSSAAFLIDPLLLAVALMMAAGFIYLALPSALRDLDFSPGRLGLMLAVGLVLRLIFLTTEPILEIDFYRYLWDGAAVNAGLNPFAVAPEEVLAGGAPQAWLDLGAAPGSVVAEINYPHLRTIYPAVAQAAFAVAHWLEPWSVTSLRLVLMGFEAVGLGLLILLLRELGRSPLWAALYWWNPLVAKELVNSAHMDSILIPFLLGALLLAAKTRLFWASGLLALASAVKLWPALLMPLLLRPVLRQPARALAAVALFTALIALLFLPLLLAQLDRGSGFVAYAHGWERNDALFGLIRDGFGMLLNTLGTASFDAGRLARLLVAGVVIGLALGLNWTATRDLQTLCQRALIVIATLYLLSPTGYPWYFVWFAPLLAVVPVTGLLLLTAFLPLYYLRFYFDHHDLYWIFERYVVWLEFGPTLLLLLWAFLRKGGPSAWWTATRRATA